MNSFSKLFSSLSTSYRLSPSGNSLRTPKLFSKPAFRNSRNFSTTLYPTMTLDSKPHTVVDRLGALGLKESLQRYPNCYPDVNPVDVYRAHLTSILTEITGVDSAIVYPALAWTQTLEKGDLVLPVPALRVKDKKPGELAEEWAAKVWIYLP
jgi:arginyl-tRNA synthetase